MPIRTDVRSYTETLVEQGKLAFDDAASRFDGIAPELKAEAAADVLALLGVVDAAIEAVSKRAAMMQNGSDGPLEALLVELTKARTAVEEFVGHLPDSAVDLTGKAQRAAGEYAAKAGGAASAAFGSLRASGEQLVSSSTSAAGREQARAELRQNVLATLNSLRELRDQYAKRGERTYAQLRRDPRIIAILGEPAAPGAEAPAAKTPAAKPAAATSPAAKTTSAARTAKAASSRTPRKTTKRTAETDAEE